MPEGNSEAPITEQQPKEISRRDFIKKAGTLAAGAALFPGDLLRKTGAEIPQNQTITKEQAEMGKGMAFALLTQVQTLNPEISSLVEHAYKHTAEITLAREQNYKEALGTFERIADSLLKFGATQALNEILKEKNVTYSWPDIRLVIDEVIGTPEQPLTKFKEYFAKKQEIDASKIEKFFWRGMLKEPLAKVYSRPTGLTDQEGLVQNTIGFFTDNSPEIIMGLFFKNPGGLASEQWIQSSLENFKGVEYNDPQPFGFVGRLFGREFPPKEVYIRAQNCTPTYS